MAGLSIEDLPAIPNFRLEQVSGNGRGCETEEDARREDRRRVQLLRSTAKQATKTSNRRAAEELADLLDYRDGEPPESMASKLYVRGVREPVIAHLQRLLASTSLTIATVHLEPARQELGGGCLTDLDPPTESDVLRAALNEKGLASLSGGAILFQDLEHEAAADLWRGGRHGLVFGEKVAAFDALRNTRNYRPRLQEGNARHTSRIRIIRNISNLDYHLTYLFKGSIYGRWEGCIEGRRVRSGKRRIPGHRHSQALLWLHRHSVDDLCQLIGMRVGTEGFFFTNDRPEGQPDASARPGNRSRRCKSE